ncbi:helicase-exonuclease AddAB subunit AddA [Leuconostoc fallax]|uniref:helicase-exonuclease AddAB subunit AddA n=1 Tax=Leuconostoc fallax TaxID=1251 RepID=UPI00209019C8|nr:helicase-exonuclease AddAB subunit AddA [Leuconostoc fallax]MCO6184042.1 helicase-exonuclease AddAB subunit AddA [Leuconostoc fallax]
MTQFTSHQQRAISEDNHNILVAASAGSGKTTVLIERLIQKILNGTSVENFLIVTFTNAAAKEMRERLERAIENRLQDVKDPQQARFLQEQLLLLPVANISTIDAYALRLIETYYHVIGLDPQFRLLSDTAERELLRQDVLDDVLAQFYEETHAHHDDFLRLVNNFGNPNQDDNLKKMILRLADFAEARPDGTIWLKNLVREYLPFENGIVSSDLFQHHIKPELLAILENLLAQTDTVFKQVTGVEALPKTEASLSQAITYLNQLIQAISADNNWDDIKNLIDNAPKLSLETKKSKAIKEDVELSALVDQASQIKKMLTGAESELVNIKKTYFILDEAGWQEVQLVTERLVDIIVTVTETFRQQFTAKKRDQRLLDFPDLGALALDILNDESTQKTVSSQFQEILVDEYQDINQLQETLLVRVSNQHNMYMVGDVKQSIYGFRQAEPTLFTNKYRLFSRDDNHDSRIDLAENFRSHHQVTQITNFIFTQLMDETLGDIAYLGEAKLIDKAAYPDQLQAECHLDIIQNNQLNANHQETSEDNEAEDDATFDTRQAQYMHLAQRILDLRQTQIYDRKATPAGMRPVEYGDIAILTRSKSGYVDLVNILREAGIPVQIDGVGNYFQTMEVYLILDILRVIDNPHQDIPLAAVLRSPMFGLNENDLAQIRLADKQHDFWRAVQATTHGDDELAKQLRTFIQLIAKWRELALQNDLVSLIWSIYEDTSWLDYATGMPGGAQRQANLRALYDYARTYQTNTHTGLFRFIRYIEQLQQAGENLGEATQESDVQAVRIMTIHASKGLEFPIVMLPEFEKKFNTSDLNGDLLIQKDAGIGLEFLEPHAQVTFPTLQKLAVRHALRQQSWSEEMRLLYVALTRAEQKIYIVGSVRISDKAENAYQQVPSNARLMALWQEASQSSGQFLPERLRLKASAYLDWLLISLARFQPEQLDSWLGDGQKPRIFGQETPQDVTINIQCVDQATIQLPQGIDTIASHTKSTYSVDDFQRAEALLDFSYANMNSSQTAAYQSVSEIKRLFEDPDQGQLQSLNIDESGQVHAANVLLKESLDLPEFMVDGSHKPSRSAVGTATHLVLQMIDFKQLITRTDVEQLLDQLVDQQRIMLNIASLINIDDVMRFVDSEFAHYIQQHARYLRREQTFAMIIPANQIYEQLNDTAPVLIHGIIDGYIADIKERTITLFDYKTDFVRPNQVEEDLEKLKLRYRGQLNLYQTALKQQYPDYTFNAPQIIALSVGRVISL